jgi:hypothetical protein
MKILNFIKSFFRKDKIILPLKERDLGELLVMHDEEEIIYKQRQHATRDQAIYLMGINRAIAEKLSPVKLGDILELKTNQNAGNRSVLVQQLFWDKSVAGPIPEINIICRTWRSKEHDILLNEKQFSISFPKEKKNDPFSVKSYHVRKNIYENPPELARKIKDTVKKNTDKLTAG